MGLYWIQLIFSLALAEPIEFSPEDSEKLVSGQAEVKLIPEDSDLGDPDRFTDFTQPNQPYLVLQNQKGKKQLVKISVEYLGNSPKPFSLMVMQNNFSEIKMIHKAKNYEQRNSRGLLIEGTSFFPTFSVLLQPGINIFYLQPNNGVFFPAWLGPSVAIQKRVEKQIFFISSLFGLSMMITIGSMCLLMAYRDSVLVSYFFYAFSTCLMVFLQPNLATLLGIDYLRKFGINYLEVLYATVGLELIATLNFISHYLDVKRWSPKLRIVLRIMGLSGVFLLFSSFFGSWAISHLIFTYIIMITLTFVWGMVKGVKRALRGSVSWGIYVFGLGASISYFSFTSTGKYTIRPGQLFLP